MEKAVLNAMAVYADTKGKCWPSQTTLAKAAGVSRKTVNEAVSSLLKKGLLRSTRTGSSNRYVITLPPQKVTTDVTQSYNGCNVGLHKHTNEEINEKNKNLLADAKAGEEMKPSKFPTGMTSEQVLGNIAHKTYTPKKGKIGPAQLDATHTEKAVLNALADYADAKGKCWPSQSTLAKVVGTSRKTVNWVIASLLKKGLLRVTHTQTSNRYMLSLPSGHTVLSNGSGCPFQVDKVAYEHTNEEINEKNKNLLADAKKEEEMKPSKYPSGMDSNQAMASIQ